MGGGVIFGLVGIFAAPEVLSAFSFSFSEEDLRGSFPLPEFLSPPTFFCVATGCWGY